MLSFSIFKPNLKHLLKKLTLFKPKSKLKGKTNSKKSKNINKKWKNSSNDFIPITITPTPVETVFPTTGTAHRTPIGTCRLGPSSPCNKRINKSSKSKPVSSNKWTKKIPNSDIKFSNSPKRSTPLSHCLALWPTTWKTHRPSPKADCHSKTITALLRMTLKWSMGTWKNGCSNSIKDLRTAFKTTSWFLWGTLTWQHRRELPITKGKKDKLKLLTISKSRIWKTKSAPWPNNWTHNQPQPNLK